MRVITGVAGAYDQHRYAYVPPKPYRTWGQVVADIGIPLLASGRLRVLPTDGPAAAGQVAHPLPLETPEGGSTHHEGAPSRHSAERDNTGLFRDNSSTIRDTDHQAMSAPNEDRILETLLSRKMKRPRIRIT